MDGNESQALLVSKVKILLTKTNDIDILLVALILLTRVEEDETYQSCLATFVKSAAQDSTRWLVTQSLSRLVAQHLQRVSSMANRQLANDLGDMLMAAIGKNHDIVRSSANDVLHSLEIYLDQCRQSSRIDTTLYLLWEIWISTPLSKEEANAMDGDDDDKDERDLFETTLTKLLDQTSDSAPEKPWEAAIAEILTRSGCRIAPLRIPRFFGPMLNAWGQKRRCEKQIEFARILLYITARIETQPPTQIIDLILACVVTDADPLLRELAWSTVVSISRNDDWAWCPPPKLTVLIRLLAGEWRIQLEHNQQSVESCGMALISAVRYIANLTTREASLPISMDQILHIRRSFDESFRTTVEFILLNNCNDNQSAFVSRVLGTFLSEMDPFEQRTYTSDESHSAVEYEISPFSALALACEKARDETTIEMLIPAVAAVLELVEGDPSRVSLLDQHGILDQSFTKFMAKVFVSTISEDCITAACQAIETWLVIAPLQETSALQETMVTFLDVCLSKRSPKEIAGSVSAILSCYASLQGDEPPQDPKTVSILQKAFHFCTHHEA